MKTKEEIEKMEKTEEKLEEIKKDMPGLIKKILCDVLKAEDLTYQQEQDIKIFLKEYFDNLEKLRSQKTSAGV